MVALAIPAGAQGPARLTGRALFAGQPVDGARIELVSTTARVSLSTNRAGAYTTQVAPGAYMIRVLSATGTQLAEVGPVQLRGGQSATQDVTVDPSGRTYRSVPGFQFVQGVRLFLYYDQNDAQAGQLVPANLLGTGQQGQATTAQGLYRFDAPIGRSYRLAIDATGTEWSFPSQVIPPTPGFAPPGPAVPESQPSTDPAAVRTYYLRFAPQSAGDEVSNNHVPLDPVGLRVRLDKSVDRPRAGIGETVTYTIRVHNSSTRAFTAASGEPAIIEDILPRGLTFTRGRASTGAALQPSIDVQTGGARLLSFGPFDLPAGGTVTLAYQVVVSADNSQRKVDNRAQMVVCASGGASCDVSARVVVSNESVATLRIDNEPIFDEGLAFGRIFCDDDQDGRRDGGEQGVRGVRVYIDTGSYSVTDSHGKWHFSRIDPGMHLIKVDAATLPPGATGRRQLSFATYFTRGLPVRRDFPLSCATHMISTDVPEATITLSGQVPVVRPVETPDGPPTVEKTVTLSGDLARMTVSVDGKTARLPAADLTMIFAPSLLKGTAGGPNLIAPPYKAVKPTFRGSFSASEPAKDWMLVIEQIRPVNVAVVRRLLGKGKPGNINWDGLDEHGKPVSGNAVYVAQLIVRGADQSSAASPRRAFGVDWGPSTTQGAASFQETLRGNLFAGPFTKPFARENLRRSITAIAKRVPKNATVLIETHWNGAGRKIIVLANTQRQAKVVRQLFARVGIDASRVKARGRGSLDKLFPPTTVQNRQRNKRVVIKVTATATAAGKPVPAAPTAAGHVKIDGHDVVHTKHRFRKTITIPAAGRVSIELAGPDGRQGKGVLWLTQAPPTTRVKPAKKSPHRKSVTIVGDLARGEIKVDGKTLDKSPLGVNLTLPDPDKEPRYALARRKKRPALAKPLVFGVANPFAAQSKSWTLTIAPTSDASGMQTTYEQQGAGPPPANITWDGRDQNAKFVLSTGRRYHAWITIEDLAGNRGRSPQIVFAVGRKRGFRTIEARGRYFNYNGHPNPRLRNILAQVAWKTKGRPKKERFLFEVVVNPPRGKAGANRRVALAVRVQKLKKYLKLVGAPLARMEFKAKLANEAVPRAQRADAVRITSIAPATTAKATTKTRVRLDGVNVRVKDGRFSIRRKLTLGASVPFEVVMADGRQATWMLRANAGSAAPGPSRWLAYRFGSAGSGATVSAAALKVALPPRGFLLRSPDLWVTGRTQPHNRISINGKNVPVADNGRFEELVALPLGKSVLVVESVDGQQNRATIRWPVKVSDSEHFVLVLADGSVSTAFASGARAGNWLADGAQLAGSSAHSSVSVMDGALRLNGRLAVYYKGRIKGGKLFDRVSITAHLDTAKQVDFEEFFQNTLDPTRDDTVYGDSSEEVRDVNSRGKLYVMAEADESSALIGNFKTDLKSSGSLFRYDRTVYGAEINFQKQLGAVKQEVKAFGTLDTEGLARDVAVFRATGGSLYYLRHGHVVEGSERVRVIVRDRDNGLVLSDKVLARNVDYSIDYFGGRMMFKSPIASTADSRFLIDNLGTSQTPLQGHPVYVEASYEYERTGNDAGGSAGGVYVRDTFFKKFSIGAGVIGEGRDDTGTFDDYRLMGVDALYRPGEHTTILAEVAWSESTDAGNFLSMDGGLSFQGLNAVGTTVADGNSGRNRAWKLELTSQLGDFVAADWAKRTRVHLYAQDISRGFYSGGTLLEQGRTKFGGQITHTLGDRDRITLRHDAQIASVPRVGPTPDAVSSNPDPLALDEQASVMVSAQYAHTGKRWLFRAESVLQRLTSTASLDNMATPQLDTQRLGFGAEVGYRFGEQLTLRLGQQGQLHTTSRDPVLNTVIGGRDLSEPMAGVATTLGADWQLAPEVFLSTTGVLRWNGDTAVQVGLKTPLDNGHMYANERFEDRGGRLVTSSVVGAQQRFGENGAGRTYGEYQLESSVLGIRNRAVLGLGHRWKVRQGWTISTGFEHQQTLGGFLPDGTPTGENTRDVLHLGSEFLLKKRVKASASVELRFDDGLHGQGAPNGLGPGVQDLVTGDPRGVTPPMTYPDHGGTPGSPLVLPPGERVQLVANAGVDWKFTDDMTFLTRFRIAHTEDITNKQQTNLPPGVPSTFTLARYVEATTGWAYRPQDVEWLDILAKLSWLYDQRPITADGMLSRNESIVFSLAPIIDLPWRLQLSSKLAYRHTVNKLDLNEIDAFEGNTDTVLWLIRMGYRLTDAWDITGEFRTLRVDRGDAREAKSGVLAELDYNVTRRVRLGLGYNFSHFSDDELGDLERDTHGFFFRVVGRY